MGAILPSRLEQKLYQAEIADATGKGEEREIEYYVVTNRERFWRVLSQIFERKERRIEEIRNLLSISEYEKAKQRLQLRKEAITSALNRTTGVKKARVEQIGLNNRGGLVDIIEIPILNEVFTRATPFEGQETPIVIFRSYHKKGKDQECRETITGDELKSIYSSEHSSVEGFPALKNYRNLFIEAIEGTDLIAAKILLDEKQVNLSLRRLRDAAEYATEEWVVTQLTLQGEECGELRGRRNIDFIEFAKEKNLMTRSDRSQARVFIYAGNAAVHHDFLVYYKLNAILFLHWLEDFVGRTIGFHRMSKYTGSKTSFGGEYEFEKTREPEYKIARAIFDQLQFLKRIEAELPSERDTVYMKEGGHLKKEDVARASINIVGRLQEIDAKFHKADEEFFDFINFCSSELKGDARDLRARDAIRTAMFAYSAFYKSKEINEERLEPRIPLDNRDPNLLQVVKRKCMDRKRYDIRGLKKIEEAEPKLRQQLELVSRVAHEYFPEYLPD